MAPTRRVTFTDHRRSANDVANEDDQASVVVAPVAIDLEVVHTVDDTTPNLGDTVTFEVVVTNRGPSDATGVGVEYQLPPGTTAVGIDASQGSYDPATGTWTIGDVPVGETVTLTVVATVDSTGPVVSTAQVDTADQVDVDSTPGNDVEIEDDQQTVELVVPPSIDISVEKTANATGVIAGGLVTFTIVVSNDGPDVATGVVVADQVPTGASFASARPSTGTYDPITGEWSVGAIRAGSSETLLVDLRLDGSRDILNVAALETANEHDPDSTPGNDVGSEDDQDEVVVEVLTSVLDVAKAANESSGSVGTVIVWTLVVTNVEGGRAEGAVLRDPIPSGTQYVPNSTTLDGVALPDQIGRSPLADGVTLPVLDVGESVTVTFRTVVVSRPETGSVVNTATLSLGSSTTTTVTSNEVAITVLVDLPQTGSQPGRPVSLALSLLVIGAFLFIVTRRRRDDPIHE